MENIEYIQIKLASPEKMLEWSHGEVKLPETVHYRNGRPEEDGLFCEKIFGPIKNYQCRCGKYNKKEYVGTVCENCGVEVNTSLLRRERMGHIKLEAPVVHYWHLKSSSYIPLLLDMKKKDIESIVYFSKYVVVDPKDTPLVKKQVLNTKQYHQALEQFGNNFIVMKGAEAIEYLLKEIDLDKLYNDLVEEYNSAKHKKTVRKRIKRRLRVVEDFRNSGNRPEWMVLRVIPVLPPDLRPLVQLDGGRYVSSDLNELYRLIINRNNRLKQLKKLKAPEIIKDNEKKLLQSAVDALIYNERKAVPEKGTGNRELKSLSSYLVGKQGRFRQNLLGKRVDYSGRSVIAVGPELKIHQCGLPRDMALELFKPFVINQMVNLGYSTDYRNAKKKIEERDEKMWDVLERVVKDRTVLLNRAPTLHKLSIIAFEPKIVEGKVIKLHPLLCGGFNADFDGDQMAVHVPISIEAQTEAELLMKSTFNYLHPQNGSSSVTPTQDMVIGCNYLSFEEPNKTSYIFFSNEREVLSYYENGKISIHDKIVLFTKNNPKKYLGHKYIVTTPGKVIFNDGMPEEIPFINNGDFDFGSMYFGFDDIDEAIKEARRERKYKPFDKSFLGTLITQVDYFYGNKVTTVLLDHLKEKGFEYATKSGTTISVSDIHIPEKKWKYIEETTKEVNKIEELYSYGRLTEEDKHEIIVEKWSKLNEKIGKEVAELLEKNKKNHIRMMISSGARGNYGQYSQLSGMRGLMADPTGRTIERPILKNFKEGLDVFDYFISSHGTRKGMADTALKTADSGYLTRKLVDAAHEVIVTEDDCGTDKYTIIEAIDGEKEVPTATLVERIIGRMIGKEIKINGKIIKKDTLINQGLAKEIAKFTDKVPIRNVFSCEAEEGICRKCYGVDLTTNRLVERGEAVGVIAAQSIGEPGTQLTMRTFHTGGVASGADITQGLPRVIELFEAKKTIKGEAVIAGQSGEVEIIEHGRLKEIIIRNKESIKSYTVPYGLDIIVENGQTVETGERLTSGSINTHELLRLTDTETVQKYIIEEIQRVYRSQGVRINDKHIEVIVNQMTNRVSIVDPGDSNEIVGTIMLKSKFNKLNEKLLKEGKRPMVGRAILMGIKETSLNSESFLSAASFQETPRILIDAAIKGRKDYIKGLKENVIITSLIPAGTGFKDYRKLSKQH